MDVCSACSFRLRFKFALNRLFSAKCKGTFTLNERKNEKQGGGVPERNFSPNGHFHEFYLFKSLLTVGIQK